MKETSLDNIVEKMRNVGEQLVQYNFPMASTKMENYINILKSQSIIIDGFSCNINYSKANYKTHFVETLQVWGDNFPFLPFFLVSKLARRFLGSNHLFLVEIPKDGRKIYSWSVFVDKRGIAIPTPEIETTESFSYEGFRYHYLSPSQIKTH